MRRRIASSRGVGLIELLVFIAILGAVTAAFLTLSSSMWSNQTAYKRKEQVNAFANTLQAAIMMPDQCVCNFEDVRIDPLALTNIPRTRLGLFSTPPTCTLQKLLAQVNEQFVEGDGNMSIADIKVEGITKLRDNFYIGSLYVRYTIDGGMAIRPT